MSSAEEAFNQMSEAQQREIRTACVLTVLGPIIRSNVSSMVSAMKGVITDELSKLESKQNRNDSDEKLLDFLKDMSKISPSLEGIRQFERMYDRAANIPGFFQIAKRCFDALPGVLQFSGFASLIQHKAISKFIAFATSWRYSGKGYDAPRGMSAPFSGYDDIINSLAGHPKCMAEFRRQADLWEQAHKKKP